MKLQIEQHQVIINSQQTNLNLIKVFYEEKTALLKEFLEDVEKNKHRADFNIQEHYDNHYKSKFAAVGGKISGCVRNFKSCLIMQLLIFMKSKYDMNLFTLKMYQTYSKVLFNSSPTQRELIPLLNNEIDLKKKLKEKKETFKVTHVSKMSWLNILGDGVNDEMRSIFDDYYKEFTKQRISLKDICDVEDKAVRILLKPSKNNNENKKED